MRWKLRAPLRAALSASLSIAGDIEAVSGSFPLSISADGRYLEEPNGSAFFIHGDTPWSIVVQLGQTGSPSQLKTYMDTRHAQGFNTIMFNMIEHYFSSQTPFYEDVAGNVPFVGMDHDTVDFSQPVEAYWARVDTIFDEALLRGMLIIAFPAYLGFGGGANSPNDQGWDSAVDAASNANLQAYGVFLANRYGPASGYGNVIWAMGGDYNAPNPEKCGQIAVGILSVDPNAIITYHGARNTSGYTVASGQSWFNLNNVYCGTDGVSYDDSATEYARGGPIPLFFIEGGYGGAESDAVVRRQAHQAVLSGCRAGHCYGSYRVWSFGDPNAGNDIGPAAALDDMTNTSGVEMSYAHALWSSYAMHKLEPKTDTSLVTSSLSSGTSRVCPALASDGSFAMIYAPSSQTVTVNLAALAPSSVRARLWNPTTGAFSTVSGSPFANSGTQNIATGGERVIVLDAA